PSIAGSPLVLAVSTQLARLLGAPGRHLDVAALLAAAGGGVPLQWALADPRTSSASAAAVLALRDTAATSGNHGALTRVLRASARTPELDVRGALVPGVPAWVVPA